MESIESSEHDAPNDTSMVLSKKPLESPESRAMTKANDSSPGGISSFGLSVTGYSAPWADSCIARIKEREIQIIRELAEARAKGFMLVADQAESKLSEHYVRSKHLRNGWCRLGFMLSTVAPYRILPTII